MPNEPHTATGEDRSGAIRAWTIGEKLAKAHQDILDAGGGRRQWGEWLKEFTKDTPMTGAARWARRRIVIFEQLNSEEAQACETYSIALTLARVRANEHAGRTTGSAERGISNAPGPTHPASEPRYAVHGTQRQVPETIVMLAMAIKELTDNDEGTNAHALFDELHEYGQAFIDAAALAVQTHQRVANEGDPKDDKGTTPPPQAHSAAIGKVMLAIACARLADRHPGRTATEIVGRIRSESTAFIEIAHWLRIIEDSGPLEPVQIARSREPTALEAHRA